MNRRVERAQALRNELSVDALLITDPVSCRYLSGFKSSAQSLLLTNEGLYLIVDFRYQEAAEKFCEDRGFFFHLKRESLSSELESITGGEGSIAFQSDYITFDIYNGLCQSLPQTLFKPAGAEISSLFNVKSEEEIAKISTAASISDISLDLFLKELKTGISEYDSARLLEEICRNNGSESPSFDTIVLFGERAALPHGVPSRDRLLRDGDTILIDFGSTFGGFCSDMTRTLFWGDPSPEMAKIYAVVERAQKAGLAFLKAGVKACEVDERCRGVIDDAGYGEYFGHGTGHGVGLRIHESPALNRSDKTTLCDGMVITVEPGIYLPGVGGVRIEDLVVVRENGYESLSKSRYNLKS